MLLTSAENYSFRDTDCNETNEHDNAKNCVNDGSLAERHKANNCTEGCDRREHNEETQRAVLLVYQGRGRRK